MMWDHDEITIEIEDIDGSVMIVKVTTPDCVIDIIGNVSVTGRVLHVSKAHVQGASAGALGRAGLNAIGRKLQAEADVDQIIIEGGTRTTGANKGRVPRTIRFPR